MKCQLKHLVMVVGFLLLPAYVALADPDISENVINNELRGLVIDRTLTPPGRRFYREFARLWWEQEKEKDVPGNLVIRELPSALKGSQIAIVYNRKPLFGTVLSPARTDIESKAKIAVKVADEKLKMIRLSRLFSNNPDLADDEF